MSSKKYLVLKGQCGMSNRILALMGAIVYADLSDRHLIIDWSDGMYGKIGENVFSKFFTYNGKQGDLNEVINAKSVYPKIWKGRLEKNAKQMWTWDFNIFKKIDRKEDVLVHSAFKNLIVKIPQKALQNSKYAGMSVNEILKYVINNSLKLNPEIQNIIDSFERENFQHPVIGVHIRHTDLDYKSNTYSNELYHEIIRNLLKQNPNAQIFLATDDKKTEEEFKRAYSNMCIITKWYPKINNGIHKSCDDDNKFQMCIDTLTDMYLLCRCDFLVRNPFSSFTALARRTINMPEDHMYTINVKRKSCCLFIEKKRELSHYKKRLLIRLIGRTTLKRNSY